MRHNVITLILLAAGWVCPVIVGATEGAGSASGQYPDPENVELELLEAHFDYELLPRTEYQCEDVVGSFYFTVRMKGISYVRHYYSGPHFFRPEDTFPSGNGYFVNPEGDVKEFRIRLASWGNFNFIGYRIADGPKGWIYPLIVNTTDYVDPAIMEHLLGGVESVGVREDDAVRISVTDGSLIVEGLSDNDIMLRVYDLRGHLMMGRTLITENGAVQVSMEDMADGLYVVQVAGNTQSVTQKILKR